VVVLTADHGVTPFPAAARARGVEAYDVALDTLITAVNRELDAAYRSQHDPENWLVVDGGMVFLRDNGRLGGAGIALDRCGRAGGSGGRPVAAWTGLPTSGGDMTADAIVRRWVHHRGDLPVLSSSPCASTAWRGYADHGKP
jgi:hypothetical protein